MIQHLNKLFVAIIILSIFTHFQRPDYNLPLFVFVLMLWDNPNVAQKLRLWYLIAFSALVDFIWIIYWAAVWSGYANREQGLGNFTIFLSVLILIIKLAIILLSFLKVDECSKAITWLPANAKSIISGPSSSYDAVSSWLLDFVIIFIQFISNI